jgi:hypothetical protein
MFVFWFSELEMDAVYLSETSVLLILSYKSTLCDKQLTKATLYLQPSW